MDIPTENDPHREVADAEERLRQAMLASDVAALDQLIAPDLLFTNHLGQLLDKQTDLGFHQSGTIRFNQIEPSDATIRVHGHFAVVSVHMRVVGSFAGTDFAEAFRYTRVWRPAGRTQWQVVAGHMSVVQA